MLHEAQLVSQNRIERLPLQVLGVVANKLRSDTDKRPGTELLACVSKRWSHITQHVSNITLVLDTIQDPAKAASLAAWLQRHAPCLGSLSLDVTHRPYPQHLDLQLQQVLPALQQAAVTATSAAGGGPLGMTRLVLKGAISSYPQLGTLLGALRSLKELQLCRSSHYNGPGGQQHFPGPTATAALGQQLTGLRSSLTRLQRLQLDWYLKGQDLSTVLPPSLTALTMVLDDDMAGAGSQQLTHLVKLRQLTLRAGTSTNGVRDTAALSDAAAVAALPCLEEVAVENRSMGQQAFCQLSRHLVRLSYTSYYRRVTPGDTTALTSLTSLVATSCSSSALPYAGDWVPVLPALTALKRMQLNVMDVRRLPEHVAACVQLQQLRDLELRSDGLCSGLSLTLSLPTHLTALTMLLGAQATPWHLCLAPLKQLQVLMVQQSILLRDEDVLTALTALTKLVVATRDGYNNQGGLQVVALQQVQTVGDRLRQLVVVGQPPCRRLEQHLAAVLPASCKWELCEHLPPGPWSRW